MQPNRRKADFVYLPSPEALRIQRQRNRVTRRLAIRRVTEWAAVWMVAMVCAIVAMLVFAP